MPRSLRRALATIVACAALLPLTAAAASATPGEVPADRPGGVFLDDDGGVFEPALEALGREGVVQGCSATLAWVCPTAGLTRGQLAAVLARALGLAGDGRVQFDDVPASGTHAAAIDALADAGIVQGCTASSFCPGGPITRGQVAAMLVAAFDLPNAQPGTFRDVTGPFAGDVAALVAAGITDGCAPGRFCPTATLTRGQSAGLLLRALGLDPVQPAAALPGTLAVAVDGRVLVGSTAAGDLQQRSRPAAGRFDGDVALAADGGALAWTRADRESVPGSFTTRNGTVHLREGAAPVVALPSQLDASSPTWSPDGRWLAYVRRDNPDFTSLPVLVRRDGTGARDLTAPASLGEGEYLQQRWSSDSSKLLVGWAPPSCLCNWQVPVVHDVAARTASAPLEPTGNSRAAFSVFLPGDDEILVHVDDADAEFPNSPDPSGKPGYLVRVDLRTGANTRLDVPVAVEALRGLSEDGTQALFFDADDQEQAYDLRTGAIGPWPEPDERSAALDYSTNTLRVTGADGAVLVEREDVTDWWWVDGRDWLVMLRRTGQQHDVWLLRADGTDEVRVTDSGVGSIDWVAGG